MEFIFDTAYDQRTLTVMAKVLRKTVRKNRSRRTHVLGWIVMVLALLLIFYSGAFNFRTVITGIAALAILIALLFEDQLNGYFARKRLLPGTENASTVFTENSFTSTTNVGRTEFQYDRIIALAETNEYFIFLFSPSHAQIYDKSTLTGGTIEAFRSFIQDKTAKPTITV